METLYQIGTCVFKRTEDGVWEPGLLLNEGSIGILDRHGQHVPKVHDFKRVSGVNLVVYPFFADDYVNHYVEVMDLK